MIVDNGDLVTLWIGPKSSDVELRLAYKAAQVRRVDALSVQSKAHFRCT